MSRRRRVTARGVPSVSARCPPQMTESRRYTAVLAVLLVSTVLAAPVAAVSGSFAADTSVETQQVNSTQESNVEFTQSDFSEEQGDVAEIGVTLTDARVATIVVGGFNLGYKSIVTVRDADNDGRVTMQFNTYGESNDGAGYSAAGVDQIVSVNIADGVSKSLAVSEYDLKVVPGDNASAPATDTATLTITDRQTNGLDIWRAPADDRLRTVNDVRDGLRAGRNLPCDDPTTELCGPTITETTEIARGDKLVVRYNVSGFSGLLAAQTPTANGYASDNTTTRFLSAVAADNGFNFTLREANPGPSENPVTLADRLAPTNTTVVADTESDSYFIVVETGSVVPESLLGNVVTASTTLNAIGKNNYTREAEPVSDTVFVTEPTVRLTDAWTGPAEAQDLTGETNLAPGSKVRVRASSGGNATSLFIFTDQVSVGENGTFTARFDFEDNQPGDTYTANLVRVGPDGPEETLLSRELTIKNTTTPTPTATATASPTPTESPTPTDSPTASPTPDSSPSPTETATASPTAGTTESTTPGFTAVLAVLALLGAVALTRFRR